MSDLKNQKCEACQAGAPQVTDQELATLMREIPEWAAPSRDGVLQLEREYKFKNFKKAWAFSNLVAQLAEDEFHHPTLTLEWGKLTVTWWTHAINGLHKNDFIMAAKTDALLAQLDA
ncbi:4a-hydroxytetrahydrobiopterin dehydratase [Aliidiomarina maris]|uniref:Putative pterin-4-alpha-carbinolamine dehydratase n=1 Tax=Aliidiomarina maris TaxID=531312 RepID=A0A327XB51_9GAMM|nr:4a-hydroxytetrahydrobiopterin dehydratase [Aliidiomarina maris]RAK01446.1 pterin-4-alpha-carbinolamine dehydratase [Aliidiomarina maris]RUO28285.1 4a-hydroxytetrahydrobiopterin dehydratase [Aliidiomarina maris]